MTHVPNETDTFRLENVYVIYVTNQAEVSPHYLVHLCQGLCVGCTLRKFVMSNVQRFSVKGKDSDAVFDKSCTYPCISSRCFWYLLRPKISFDKSITSQSFIWGIRWKYLQLTPTIYFLPNLQRSSLSHNASRRSCWISRIYRPWCSRYPHQATT